MKVREIYPSARIIHSGNQWYVERLVWKGVRIQWINIGAGSTKEFAWENAWDTVSKDMIRKLEL